MTKTLGDVQKSVERFVLEAENCAREKLGFAAMLTIFPVMLSISESIYHHNNNKELFKKFVPHMADKTWFISRGSNTTLSNHDIAIDLFQTRDALAHQLSLPNHIGLINTKAEAKQYFKDYTTTSRVISVTEFVEAVDETVKQIIKSHPKVVIDSRGISRTPGVRVELSDGSSASKIG